MNAGKHRARGLATTHGRTQWPRHRDSRYGPAPADGMTEYQEKWVAAMKLRAVENYQRQKAACN